MKYPNQRHITIVIFSHVKIFNFEERKIMLTCTSWASQNVISTNKTTANMLFILKKNNFLNHKKNPIKKETFITLQNVMLIY